MTLIGLSQQDNLQCIFDFINIAINVMLIEITTIYIVKSYYYIQKIMAKCNFLYKKILFVHFLFYILILSLLVSNEIMNSNETMLASSMIKISNYRSNS